MLTLRSYQRGAVQTVYDYLRQHDDNPCVVLPTASGKMPVLATICKDAVTQWSGRAETPRHRALGQHDELLAGFRGLPSAG